MKKKNRRIMALIIVAVMFSALPIIAKLILISPLYVQLVMDWDNFSLNLMKEGHE